MKTVKHLAGLMLLAWALLASVPSAWAIGSSVDSSGQLVTCGPDPTSSTGYRCSTGREMSKENYTAYVQGNSKWWRCEDWNVTGAGIQTGVPGSTGNCWDFADNYRLGSFDKTGSSSIDMAFANHVVNGAYATDADGTKYYTVNIATGDLANRTGSRYLGLGLGAYRVNPDCLPDFVTCWHVPDVPGTPLVYQHQYIDTDPGTGSTTDLFDVVQNGLGSDGLYHGTILVSHTIVGDFALVIGAGDHEGLFYGTNQGDGTITFSYKDYNLDYPDLATTGFQPDDWGNITRVAIYTVNAVDGVADSTVPEPATWVLMLSTLLGWALISRKQRALNKS